MSDRARAGIATGHWPRWIWWALAALVGAWLVWMTQVPQTTAVAGLAPLTETGKAFGISPRLLIGFLGNIVVFVPLGGLVARAVASPERRPAAWAFWGTLGGALLSGAIEALQSLSATRFPDWRDLALNTLGALLGSLWVAWLVHTRSGQSAREDG